MATKIAKLSSDVSELQENVKLLIHALLGRLPFPFSSSLSLYVCTIGNDKRTVVSAGVQTDVLITDQNSKSMNQEENPKRNDKRSMEDTENIADLELNKPPRKLIKTHSLPLNPRNFN